MEKDGDARTAKKACHQCGSRTEVYCKPKGRKGFWECENSCGPEGLASLF